MRERAKEVAVGLVVTYAIIASGITPPLLWVLNQQSKLLDSSFRSEQHHRTQHWYFFEGANKRGLLTICDDGVKFKEDCADD